MDTIREALERALEDAKRGYKSNKESGSPAESTAYDAGRIAGLQEAIEIVDSLL